MQIEPEVQSQLNDVSTKEHILKVATQLFAEHGFEGTTIRSICLAANVNVSLISYYFDGKEGLYQEIFKHLLSSHLQSTSALLSAETVVSKDDFRIKLGLFLEMVMERTAENPAAVKLMHAEIMSGFPHIADAPQIYFRQIKEKVENFVLLGQQRGFVRRELNSQISVMVLMNAIMGFATKSSLCSSICELDFSNKKDRVQLLNTSLEILFEGILIK